MRLALVCANKKLSLGESRVIGRNDFPDQQQLSRKHFQIRNENGRLLVTDLGSANGTSLRGIRLTPNVDFELTTEDQLTAGGLTFSLTELPSAFVNPRYMAAAGIFLALFFMLVASPSMAWGRALGWQGVATMLVTLGLPLLASVWFFDRISQDSPWPVWKYALAVLIATMILNDGIVELISATTDMDRVLAVNKIRFFCLSKFTPDRCVAQITSCPRCAGYIGTAERQQMADRLHSYYREPGQSSR